MIYGEHYAQACPRFSTKRRNTLDFSQSSQITTLDSTSMALNICQLIDHTRLSTNFTQSSRRCLVWVTPGHTDIKKTRSNLANVTASLRDHRSHCVFSFLFEGTFFWTLYQQVSSWFRRSKGLISSFWALITIDAENTVIRAISVNCRIDRSSN